MIAVHRAVDVVGAGAAWADLVVARLHPADVHVDAFAVYDGRDGVEEGQRILAGQRLDRAAEGRGGERAGRDDDAVPILRRQAGDLAALERDQRMARNALGDLGGKAVAVHRQRAARRQLMRVARRHDQRAAAAHFLMQQPDRVGFPLVRAEGVGADQLGETAGLMRLGHADGAHLVQDDRCTPASAICQAASDPASPPPMT